MHRCDTIRPVAIFFIVAMAFAVMTMSFTWDRVKVSIPVTGSETLVWTEELDLAMRAVIIDPAYSHAVEEHGRDALVVRECLNKNGPYVSFQVDPGRRYLRVCLIDEKTVGFQIVDIVGRFAKEKTAYIKDNFTCIKDIFDYARKMGYPRFTKPIF